MRHSRFWLDDRQWEAIRAAQLLGDPARPKFIDDRTIISGIVFILRYNIPWRECPEEYGPYTTVLFRYLQLRAQPEVWQQIVFLVETGKDPG